MAQISQIELHRVDEMHRVLSLCAYSLGSDNFRKEQADLREETHLYPLGSLLAAAEIPAAEYCQQAWLSVAKQIVSDKNLHQGLAMVGEDLQTVHLLPFENQFFGFWHLYNVFDYNSALEWFNGCAVGESLHELMKDHELYEALDEGALGFEQEFENYFDKVQQTFEFSVNWGMWKEQLVTLSEDGPRNSKGQSCLDVIDSCLPDWRTRDFGLGV